jgi:hypothetical protein
MSIGLPIAASARESVTLGVATGGASSAGGAQPASVHVASTAASAKFFIIGVE